MEKCPEYTICAKGIAVLTAAFIAVLLAGCAPQGGASSSEPVSLEITQSGDIAGGLGTPGVLPTTPDYPGVRTGSPPGRVRNYTIGRGMASSSTNLSAAVQSVCLWDTDPKQAECWPADRPAQVELDSTGIRSVSYQSPDGKPIKGGAPIGAAPTPIPGKGFSIFLCKHGCAFKVDGTTMCIC